MKSFKVNQARMDVFNGDGVGFRNEERVLSAHHTLLNSATDLLAIMLIKPMTLTKVTLQIVPSCLSYTSIRISRIKEKRTKSCSFYFGFISKTSPKVCLKIWLGLFQCLAYKRGPIRISGHWDHISMLEKPHFNLHFLVLWYRLKAKNQASYLKDNVMTKMVHNCKFVHHAKIHCIMTKFSN